MQLFRGSPEVRESLEFQWPLRGLGQCNRVNRVPEELLPEFQWPLRGLGQCNTRVNRVPEPLAPEFQWPLRGLRQCNGWSRHGGWVSGRRFNGLCAA